ATGVNTRLPIWPTGITWPAVTAVPLSFRVPAPGSDTTVTDWSVSPSLSGSVNGKSLLANVYAVLSVVVTVWVGVVGGRGVATTTVCVAALLDAVPSLTVNWKLVYGFPEAAATGVNTRLPIWPTGITWPAVTAVPLSFSVPAPGRLVMVTDCGVSPSLSGSVNGKSALVNVYAALSVVVTVWSAVVGGVGVTTTDSVAWLLDAVPS